MITTHLATPNRMKGVLMTGMETTAARLSSLYHRLRGRRLDDLVTDPVCHMWVDPTHPPAQRRHGEDEYYFCSPHCARRFESDPERWTPPDESYGFEHP